MKKLLKLFSWLFESNRPAHIAAGTLVFLYTVAVCILIGTTLMQMAWLGVWGSFIAGVSAEVKDVQHKGKFDVLDILATMLFPVLALVLILIGL
jgi:hypothetical protein